MRVARSPSEYILEYMMRGNFYSAPSGGRVLKRMRYPFRFSAACLLLTLGGSAVACGPGKRLQTNETQPESESTEAIVVTNSEVAALDGTDAPPRVALALRNEDGSLSPIAGKYTHALEFRNALAAVTIHQELRLVRANGSHSVVAHQLDGLPTRGSDGSLFYSARFGEIVELYQLAEEGTSRRLASFRGSATRLSPRRDGTVVFVGSKLGGVSGIWVHDSMGTRCLTNCELRVGQHWGDSYRPLPGETETVTIDSSTVEWQTAEGARELAPLRPGPSAPVRGGL